MTTRPRDSVVVPPLLYTMTRLCALLYVLTTRGTRARPVVTCRAFARASACALLREAVPAFPAPIVLRTPLDARALEARLNPPDPPLFDL